MHNDTQFGQLKGHVGVFIRLLLHRYSLKIDYIFDVRMYSSIKSMCLRTAFFHTKHSSLLTQCLLGSCSAAPLIPSIIDDLVLWEHTIDDSLYLGPLVISFQTYYYI